MVGAVKPTRNETKMESVNFTGARHQRDTYTAFSRITIEHITGGTEEVGDVILRDEIMTRQDCS